ncbi:hypothetical protein HPP92_007580 [Vanilla planifolia]|uniref:N-acetyltransferase domain-containing protein n=1 Tax=Vanilla planifolia TaxID=51239 RepID=A0A835V614_VANPL|nr:hypothetical protein HPP92_007580 [Vanilla planifolia]
MQSPVCHSWMMSLPVRVRSFDWDRDRRAVEELERLCQAGFASARTSLVTITMGDPLCRVRHSPIYEMLVAEVGDELVGIIRGTIKRVLVSANSMEAIVGYLLGLRVSPLHRRRGIASHLVSAMEDWFASNAVEWAYMATEKSNEPSIQLFTSKFGYVKFRQPILLVNPVGQRKKPLNLAESSVKVTALEVDDAARLYRRSLSSAEFFPLDIDRILSSEPTLGTWVACPRDEHWATASSLAVLSVWNGGEVYKLRLGRAPWAFVALSKASRILEMIIPAQLGLGFPSVPDLSSAFGFYFMYGLHAEGPRSASLLRFLCLLVHNMAVKDGDVKVVVAELGGRDELRHHVPHFGCMSCSEDLWCVKSLRGQLTTGMGQGAAAGEALCGP